MCCHEFFDTCHHPPRTCYCDTDPSDLYLLRLAAGSISGVLTNIDEDGAPAMAFHGDPKISKCLHCITTYGCVSI